MRAICERYRNMGRVPSECRFNINVRTCDKTRRYYSVKDFYAAYATGWEPLTEEQRLALTLALDEANVYRDERWVALPDPMPETLSERSLASCPLELSP